MEIAIKRIYEPAGERDGARILVDRLWPRGVSKEKAQLSAWLKDVAPSPGLRAWFGHREERFEEFAGLYRAELEADPAKRAAVEELLRLSKEGNVTLLYGAKNPAANQAAVLQAYLAQKAAR